MILYNYNYSNWRINVNPQKGCSSLAPFFTQAFLLVDDFNTGTPDGSAVKERKYKYVDIYMSPIDIYDYACFISKLSRLDGSLRYSTLFRVCYGTSPTYKMLGDQITINYADCENFDCLHKSVFEVVQTRLELSMLNYGYTLDEIITIQLIAYEVRYTDEVKKKRLNLGLSSLGEAKDLVDVAKTKVDLVFNKILPTTTDLSKYGKPLPVTTSNGIIDSVMVANEQIQISSLIRKANSPAVIKKNDIVLTSDAQIFSPSPSGRPESNNKFLVSVKSTSPRPIVADTVKQHDIDVFNLDGRHVLKLSDKEVNSSKFTRTTGNVTKTIDVKSSHVATSIKLDFNHIKVPIKTYLHKQLSIPDPQIGTLDLETYLDNGGVSKVFCIGYYTRRWGPSTFYINDAGVRQANSLNSDILVLRCIDSMVTARYSGYTFYVHNLGGYDIVFILTTLIRANASVEKYKFEIFAKDGLIMSFTIKVGKYHIKLVDSYNILTHSLERLGYTYNLEVRKDMFPYSFVKTNKLFYIGHKPDISFYNLPSLSPSDEKDGKTPEQLREIYYSLIPNDGWDMEKETIKYLEKDNKSLLEVIGKFSDYIYRKHLVQVSGSLSISSLAMKIFLTKFYANNIPLINSKSIYDDIKKSYFGGITEVYKPYGENLYYYDVNSLYPYAALNPMPGTNCVFEDSISCPISNVKDFFGFYYCTIKTSSNYLGLLPLRTKQGVTMPNGEWEGWYFSEELTFASFQGYDIFVHKGYTFNKQFSVFDGYVKAIYKVKSNTKSVVERAVSKSLLNNLLGRFGLDIAKSKTELVDEVKHNEIIQTKRIKSSDHIDDKVLLTYDNKVSPEICEELNVDYRNSVLTNLKNNVGVEKTFTDVSIAIASAVTSYARISFSKTKLDILAKGGELYYSDTDSIVTNIPLDEGLVGNSIGQYKLEHNVKRGYFITSKTYCLVLASGKVIIVAKGINNHNLEEKDFISLYKGNSVPTERTQTNKKYSGGYVNIDVANIVLNGAAYAKRKKIFKEGVWVDTQPLVYTNNLLE